MRDRLPVTRPAVTPLNTSGSGYKLWETRRANQFSRCVEKLAKWRTADVDELLLAAHEISKQIADRVPEPITELPRGYTLVTSCSWRVISLDGSLFSSLGRNVAGREQLARLFSDLRSGWLKEIDDALNEANQVDGGGSSDA